MRELIAEGSANPYIHARLGNVLLQSGDYCGAEAAFRTAAAMDPNHHGFRATLADVLIRQGNCEKALAILRELVNEGSADSQAHSRVGALLQPDRPGPPEGALVTAVGVNLCG